jgi:hypothetical protein
VGKEEGLIFFRTPDQLEEFDRIKDVVDRIMMRKDPAEALAADAYEANLARGGGGASGGHGAGTRGGSATTGKVDGATSAAMSSSAARRAAVLPISRNRKKKDDASGGAERGGGEKSTSSTGLHPGKPHSGAGGSAKSPNGPDVSWKEGRSFPKKSSSIGNRYQVSHIPEAGTFDPTQPPESDQLYVRPPVLGLPELCVVDIARFVND